MNFRWLCLAATLGVCSLSSVFVIAQDVPAAADPFAKWEAAIQSFEADDAAHPKTPGQVLFVGSSSIRLWDLQESFPDLDAINRGFGGSEVADSVHFYERLVKPYAPRQIVMYAGDNDLSKKKTPAQVHAAFEEFVNKVHQDFPACEVIYVAVKPSLKRWSLINEVRATNSLIAKMAEGNDRLTLLDIDAPMIGADGMPKPELFAKDGLHLSAVGYQLWSDLLRPHLVSTLPAKEARHQPLRQIYDAYHPWKPPTTIAAWEVEAERIRRQILVSNGLWPLPEKTPLDAVVHGKIDMGDYTVEKVFFRSRPGHYVTGNLYRPKNITGKVPGVLSPHGHWKDGRFYDAAGDAKAQLASGAEQFESAAHSPIQARMVQLARMGCVVFHYDMIGYADSQPLDHRTGFNDAQAALWLHNLMGLQTWNSIRCLDFLATLSDVDTNRIAMTGASGGGTQTMILAAIDPRIAVSFPAVMVSTGMQGGCVCENASYLRQGVNNVAFAALFAPKPQAMSGADDWTIAIESKGLPELKQIYSLYGHPDLVDAKAFPQFKHNYNSVARQMMYNWLNEHLDLGIEGPIQETDFKRLSREELTVFNAEHPVPQDALNAEALRKLMVDEERQKLAKWRNADAEQYRNIVGGAAEVMLNPSIQNARFSTIQQATDDAGLTTQTGVVTHSGEVLIPTRIVQPVGTMRGTVFWFGIPANDKALPEQVQQLARAGYRVVSADLFLTGTALESNKAEAYQYKVNEQYPGYTYCYNNTLLTERVRDVLAVIAAVPDKAGAETHLIGEGRSGLWALLARSVLPTHLVQKTIVDLQEFNFESVNAIHDENLLPGALKYGGLGGFIRLIRPAPLVVYGVTKQQEFTNSYKAYESDLDTLKLSDRALNSTEVVQQILSPQ